MINRSIDRSIINSCSVVMSIMGCSDVDEQQLILTITQGSNFVQRTLSNRDRDHLTVKQSVLSPVSVRLSSCPPCPLVLSCPLLSPCPILSYPVLWVSAGSHSWTTVACPRYVCCSSTSSSSGVQDVEDSWSVVLTGLSCGGRWRRGGGKRGGGAAAAGSRRCSAPPPGSGAGSGSGPGPAPPRGPGGPPPPRHSWRRTPRHHHGNAPDRKKKSPVYFLYQSFHLWTSLKKILGQQSMF